MARKEIIVERKITIGDENDVWSTQVEDRFISEIGELTHDDKELIWEEMSIDIDEIKKKVNAKTSF